MQNIEEIYKEYFKTVYKYLFCLTSNHDLAEELTQETFYKAVKKIQHINHTIIYKKSPPEVNIALLPKDFFMTAFLKIIFFMIAFFQMVES